MSERLSETMVEICRNLENRFGKGSTVSSQLTRFGVKALPSKGQSVISLLLDTPTLVSMRKARRCLAFLYGVAEDAIEDATWHDSPMAAKEEYGCITTTFKRPDWTGANTPNQRTGTASARTGTTSRSKRWRRTTCGRTSSEMARQ